MTLEIRRRIERLELIHNPAIPYNPIIVVLDSGGKSELRQALKDYADRKPFIIVPKQYKDALYDTEKTDTQKRAAVKSGKNRRPIIT